MNPPGLAISACGGLITRKVPWAVRGRQRERPLYPPRATREVVANALCHRDYTIPGGAVSMAMYDDRLEIINTGTLHFDITPEKLTQPHQSKPWNPIVAGVFYRAGIIEQWGTGTLKVIDWCRDNANPAPVWEEQSGSVVVTFRPSPGFAGQAGTQVTPEVTPEVAKILPLCQSPMSKRELQLAVGIRDEKHFREAYLRPALDAALLERTIPEKPQSSKQRYRLTAHGREWLRQHGRP